MAVTNEKFVYGIQKSLIQKKIDEYSQILRGEMPEDGLKRQKYLRALDTIDELKEFIRLSNPSYTFITSKQIMERIETYRSVLLDIQIKTSNSRINEISQEISQAKKQLEELKAKSVNIKNEPDVDERARIEELKRKITERKREIVSTKGVLSPNVYRELRVWESEVKVLENPELKSKTDIANLENVISQKENELANIINGGQEHEDGNESVKAQKRYIENNIKEFQELIRPQELFKINDKGQVEIKYPLVTPKIDEEAVKREYEARKKDMLDKFYGNRKKEKEFLDRIERIGDYYITKKFVFKDERGKDVVGEYTTIEPYEELREDLEFLQMDEMIERLERITKYEAGDKSVYKDFENEKEAYLDDEEYLETNNNSYNRTMATDQSLITLGKYGEKVPYNKMQEGEGIKNAFRAIGNVGKFFRNTITAPVNKFIIGKVAYLYHNTFVSDEGNIVGGAYTNKRTHRYVARREYFESQGKGYISSRLNSIFNAKKGNKAVLSAKADEIKESITKKYTEIAKKEALRKQQEFIGKNLDEQIHMVTLDLKDSSSPENKAKLQIILNDLQKAKEQLGKDRVITRSRHIPQTIQTDPVSLEQHQIANVENATRTITGIKMATTLGFHKYIGPNLKTLVKLVPIEKISDNLEHYQRFYEFYGEINDSNGIPIKVLKNKIYMKMIDAIGKFKEVDLAEGIYENIRRTETREEVEEREAGRNYDFEAGFSGSRRADYKSLRKVTRKNKYHKKEINDGKRKRANEGRDDER